MSGKFKKVMSIILSLSLILCCFGCNSENKTDKNNKELSGTIDVWAWNAELLTSGIIDKFNEEYPNININLITIPNANNAYSTKLLATLRSGIRTPDVYLAESAVVKKFCNMDYYEDLSKEPYNAEELIDDMVPYTVDLGRNEDDNSIRALTWQATPGGFFYKRSLAKQYLGTDDPATIQKMMTTMDDFLALGEKIKTNSNGSVSLLADYSELLYVILGNRKNGWVVDGKLTIDESVINYLDLATNIRSKGYDRGYKQWTSNWSDSMSDTSVFGYMLPTWGLSSTLQGNAPDTSGDWAFVEAPTPYYWGGTWLGIYKDSKKKDLAWEFVKYITTNTDYLKEYAKDSGDFVNNTKVQDEFSNSDLGKNEFLSGQNVYSSYSKLVKSVNGKTLTQYDEVLNGLWGEIVEDYVLGKITKEQVIPKFKEEVRNKYPEIKID